MKEIKFRAWDEDNNTMVPYERLLYIGTKMFGSYNLPSVFDCYNKALLLLFGGNDIYMQYTGLKDKNGTEIYEGDIVFVTDDEGNSGMVDTGVGEIELLDGLWYICGNVQNGLYDINKSFEIKTIGNIYENPELLEGRE